MKLKLLALIVVGAVFSTSCTEKEFDPDDPAGSFAIAQEPYDDENYEIALTKLGEYKSRFPYSKFAVLAELYIANSQFQLGRYDEAAISYEQFTKLHPKHEQADFALFRVGECFWQDATDEPDRDQELTIRAVEEWRKLIAERPDSEYAAKAKELVAIGERRIALSMEFVYKFYCKQHVYHSCAFRAIGLAESYPQFPKIRQEALKAASKALQFVADEKEKDPTSDKNIYHQSMNAGEIRALSEKYRQEAGA